MFIQRTIGDNWGYFRVGGASCAPCLRFVPRTSALQRWLPVEGAEAWRGGGVGPLRASAGLHVMTHAPFGRASANANVVDDEKEFSPLSNKQPTAEELQQTQALKWVLRVGACSGVEGQRDGTLAHPPSHLRCPSALPACLPRCRGGRRG